MFEVDQCRPEPTAALLGWLVKHGVALPTMAAIFGQNVETVQEALDQMHLPPPGNHNLNGHRNGPILHQGYHLILAPGHPFPDHKHKYVFEHRLVVEAEELGGHYLRPEEHVHHKNGLRSCNRASNLEVKPRGEHVRDHRTHHVSEKDREEIIRRYRGRESAQRIADQMPHVGDKKKVLSILREAGESIRGPHEHGYEYMSGNTHAKVQKGKTKRHKHPHLEDPEWLREMYDVLGKCDREIAEVVTELDGCHCGNTTVFRHGSDTGFGLGLGARIAKAAERHCMTQGRDSRTCAAEAT